MQRASVRILSVLLAFVLLSGGTANVAAQEEPLPPQVIDVWPLPGVELAPSEPVTITFDLPMDQASVDAAFSLSPSIPGELVWLDTRTVQFAPQDPWPRATTISATIGAGATAENGAVLEEAYTFDIATVGPLVVASVTPEAETGAVDANARIVVTFTRPVVPLTSTADMSTLPNPLTIEPQVSGTGEWINTSIFAFTPDEPLAGSTEYTVTVAEGLEAADGAVLDTPYTWSFRTLPPEVISLTPTSGETGVLLDQPIVVKFSQPMARTSVESAFALAANGQNVPGAFLWSDDGTVMSFQPAERLAMETTYTIQLAPTAQSENGSASIEAGISRSFETVRYPHIVETNPSSNAVDISTYYPGVDIVFSSPMNFETLRDRIVISPEPEDWYPQVSDWDPNRIQLMFGFDASTTYTVTILAGVEDIYGNAIPTDYTFTFSTMPLQPDAYPIINGSFMITSAYRDDTRMGMIISGDVQSWFELYALQPTDLATFATQSYDDWNYNFEQGYTFDGARPPWASEATRIRSWSETFSSGNEVRKPFEVLLASEQGGALSTGLYWVAVDSSVNASTMGTGSFQFALAVATSNITVKRTPDETLFWVTDLATAEPVAGATITIYHSGAVLATGQTDAQGVYRTPVDVPDDNEQLLVTAEAEGVFGAWYSSRDQELPTERGYLYTDRPVYRPGETVYFRGVARDRRDMDFAVPDEPTVQVTIRSFDDRTLYEEDVAVTSFGTFSGEFALPDDAPIGDLILQVDFGDSVSYQYGYFGPMWNSEDATQILFTVADFRPPEYEVSVTAQSTDVVQGDPVDVLTEASYYAGGGVSGAPVQYNVFGQQANFNYEGPERYSFTDDGQQPFYYVQVAQTADEPSQTNDAGQSLYTVENTLPPSPLPMEITVEATVSDESGQPISGRTTIMTHPASIYVGVRSENYFGEVSQPTSVDIITVTTDSLPVPDASVDLELVKTEWIRTPIEGRFGRYRWTEAITPISSDRVVTDAEGRATFTFTPDEPGLYRVRATTLDERERANSSSVRIWVAGEENIYFGQPTETITMIADRDSYLPGDTAQIFIPLPYADASTVLITTERADIMMTDIVQTEGTTLVYDLPITDAYAPTVHFTVTVIRGATADEPNPNFVTSALQLNVEPVRHLLNVEVSPSAELAAPRSTVAFDLRTTDADGNPVSAEVGVALTDEAVLDLMPANSGTLREAFYGQQPNYVNTTVALSALLDTLTDGIFPGGRGGGGGGGGAPVFVRDNFIYTPLWAPHVATGEDGEATVSIELPDNLTTWRLDARAVTQATDVGQTTTEIVSTLPLIVRPVAPRFLVVGDRVELAAVINNNTDREQVVETLLEATGVTLESPAAQSVTIAAGSRARVAWAAVVQDVPGVDLVFSAVGEDGVRDAARPALATGPDGTIPVYAYTAPDTAGTGGVLREAGAVTEAVALPTRLSDLASELRVQLDPSLAAATLSTLDFLRNYPHQSTEQTVSSLLPNIATLRTAESLVLDDPNLVASLEAEVEAAIERLNAAQNADGSWSWFAQGSTGDPLVTAYAAFGLQQASAYNPALVNPDVLDRALNYVEGQLVRPTVDTPAYLLNRQAFFLFVLAESGYANRQPFDTLMDYRERLSYAGRAYLLMAADTAFPSDGALINPLISDLTTAALLSANGTHWEEAAADWHNWTSDTRTTAVVLNALVRTQPDNALLPGAVRWLMTARRADHWPTTQETAWAVLALSEWMWTTGELQGQYTYEARLNDATLNEGTVEPATVDEARTLRVSVENLLLDGANRLTIARGEGNGALYYTTYLDLNLPVDEVGPLSRGVTVTREYFDAANPDQPLTEAQVGDIVTVRLSITLPEDIYYFVLEDPLPAGLEPIDPSLLTSTQAVSGPQLVRPGEDDPFWYWGYWWFDHTEFRDEQTNLYADFLPRGSYVYTYQARATVPGSFQVMPAQGYAMYLPEVFGRTGGATFIVQPSPQLLAPAE